MDTGCSGQIQLTALRKFQYHLHNGGFVLILPVFDQQIRIKGSRRSHLDNLAKSLAAASP